MVYLIMNDTSVSTKEKILSASLELFAKNGTKATTVEQIASAVGIRAPSLYKHFKNKKEIIDSIFCELERRYQERIKIESEVIRNSCTDKKNFFESNFDKVLFYVVETVEKLVDYSLNDDFMNKSAIFMKVEQYNSSLISLKIDREFGLRLIKPFREMFEKLIKEKILKNLDITLMTIQFLSPIETMVDCCRRDTKPEKIKEYKDMIKAHVKQFFNVYKPN